MSVGRWPWHCLWRSGVSRLCPLRWSTGVIMYTLLAGSPPFWHRKQMLMLRMIMSGSYQFGSPEWDDYSDTVKDLVRPGTAWLRGGCRAGTPSPLPKASYPALYPRHPPPSRSLASWWCAPRTAAQQKRPWRTPSSSSTWWRRCGTSALPGSSRCEAPGAPGPYTPGCEAPSLRPGCPPDRSRVGLQGRQGPPSGSLWTPVGPRRSGWGAPGQ